MSPKSIPFNSLTSFCGSASMACLLRMSLCEVTPMLKITIEHEVEEICLRLEGDLAGTWVRELEETWRALRATPGGKPACLDLTGGVRVDDAGRYLLALIQETGARMVSTGLAMKDLLDSIARDWPGSRASDRGWALAGGTCP